MGFADRPESDGLDEHPASGVEGLVLSDERARVQGSGVRNQGLGIDLMVDGEELEPWSQGLSTGFFRF